MVECEREIHNIIIVNDGKSVNFCQIGLLLTGNWQKSVNICQTSALLTQPLIDSTEAASIIVAHNHPSGSLTPSLDDLAITQQLKEAARLLGIEIAKPYYCLQSWV